MTDGLVAFVGDAMLGRGIGRKLDDGGWSPLQPCLQERLADADGIVLNLECAIAPPSMMPTRRWSLNFRCPAAGAAILADIGVSAVCLANNHALDYGPSALVDTIAELHRNAIATYGAGANTETARSPLQITLGDQAIKLVGVTDHPRRYEAETQGPTVAFASLNDDVPDWLVKALSADAAEAVVCTPHWGPNFERRPRKYMMRAAADFHGFGATLVAGHSAHRFQAVERDTVYNMGDFIDDYPRVPILRNDLGLVWFAAFRSGNLIELRATPIKISACGTRVATETEVLQIARRLRRLCRPGTVWFSQEQFHFSVAMSGI